MADPIYTPDDPGTSIDDTVAFDEIIPLPENYIEHEELNAYVGRISPVLQRMLARLKRHDGSWLPEGWQMDPRPGGEPGFSVVGAKAFDFRLNFYDAADESVYLDFIDGDSFGLLINVLVSSANYDERIYIIIGEFTALDAPKITESDAAILSPTSYVYVDFPEYALADGANPIIGQLTCAGVVPHTLCVWDTLYHTAGGDSVPSELVSSLPELKAYYANTAKYVEFTYSFRAVNLNSWGVNSPLYLDVDFLSPSGSSDSTGTLALDCLVAGSARLAAYYNNSEGRIYLAKINDTTGVLEPIVFNTDTTVSNLSGELSIRIQVTNWPADVSSDTKNFAVLKDANTHLPNALGLYSGQGNSVSPLKPSCFNKYSKVQFLYAAKTDTVPGVPIYNSLLVWGNNNSGCLGLGHTASVYTPTPVALPGVGGVKFAGGTINVSFIIDAAGNLYTCGSGSNYKSGHGTTSNRSTFAQVGAGIQWQAASVWDHLLALDAGGIVYGCGSNTYGKLAQGTTSGTVQNLTQIFGLVCKFVLATNASSFVITDTGDVYACGRSQYGSLGLGTTGTVDYSSWQKTGPPNAVKVVSTGQSSYILDEAGAIWTAGYNNWSQLGLGNSTNQGVFTKLTLDDSGTPLPVFVDIACVSSGLTSSFGACSASGEVYTCGARQVGRVGQPAVPLNGLSRLRAIGLSNSRETAVSMHMLNNATLAFSTMSGKFYRTGQWAGTSPSLGDLPLQQGISTVTYNHFNSQENLSLPKGRMFPGDSIMMAAGASVVPMPDWTQTMVIRLPETTGSGISGTYVSRFIPASEATPRNPYGDSVYKRLLPNTAGSFTGPTTRGFVYHSRGTLAHSKTGNVFFQARASSPWMYAVSYTPGGAVNTWINPPAPGLPGRPYIFTKAGVVGCFTSSQDSLHLWPWDDITGFGTKYTSPSFAGQVVTWISWNASGTAIALTCDSAPYVRVFEWDDITGFGAEYSGPAAPPQASCYSAEWHPSEDYIVVSGSRDLDAGRTSGVHFYEWSNATGFGNYIDPGMGTVGNLGGARRIVGGFSAGGDYINLYISSTNNNPGGHGGGYGLTYKFFPGSWQYIDLLQSPDIVPFYSASGVVTDTQWEGNDLIVCSQPWGGITGSLSNRAFSRIRFEEVEGQSVATYVGHAGDAESGYTPYSFCISPLH